jgi:hypothetical protein
MRARKILVLVIGIAFSAPVVAQAASPASPSPVPLGLRGVTVEVVPVQAPPGLSLSVPAADHLEMPPHRRSFRAAPRAGRVASPTLRPSPRSVGP